MKQFASLNKRNTWDLIWVLFRTDFKLKYNDSVLGFIWVLIKPFSIFAIMYFVVTKVFNNTSTPNFGLYLLLGNMVMAYWNEGTNQGMESLLSKANLIAKVNFPRYIVLISSTLLASVTFIINLCIFAIIAATKNIFPTPLQLLWFLFCVGILYAVITVTSMFLSITYVKFRDLKQIWELFNQILLWLTPVFYPITALLGKSEILDLIITKINPIAVILQSGRNAILYNDITNQITVFAWVGVITVTGIVGYLFYTKSIKRIAEFF